MIDIYKKIWNLFDTKEKKRALRLLFLMVIMAFMEVIGMGAIMPFLSVLGSPQVVETNQYLSILYKYFSFEDTKYFLLFLGLLAVGFLLINAAVRSVTYYTLFIFSNMRRHSISEKLIIKYLHQPYNYFFTKNSSDISKTVLSETDMMINQVVRPSLFLIAYSIVVMAILIVLILVNPLLAFVLMIIIGGLYTFMYLLTRKYLTTIGLKRAEANESRYKIVSETFGGIKELKVLGREQAYIDCFRRPSVEFSKYNSMSLTISYLPSFLVEVVFFSAILFIGIGTVFYENSDLGMILPMLGLYALGALKLRPAANNIYESLTTMKFGASSLDKVIHDLEITTKVNGFGNATPERLQFHKSILLKNIFFYYTDEKKPALDSITLEIKAKSMVGIIGTTGAGKSTFIDLILGLLTPDKGTIHIDGELLGAENVRAWQNSIGYVPQTIFLADDTVANNIAFGVEQDKVNKQRVEQVAKIAQAHRFVGELLKGYDTIIGEDGVKLSGGQRQRLGIARALYHDPDLLILDEATSALDNQTERAVMSAINKMGGTKTIIMIAHRLNTLESCDMVVKLENGKIVDTRYKMQS